MDGFCNDVKFNFHWSKINFFEYFKLTDIFLLFPFLEEPDGDYLYIKYF